MVTIIKKYQAMYNLSTSGGTSDGLFIAPSGTQVVESGPVSATIHEINECVKVEELDRLARLYKRIVELGLADT